MVKSTSSDMEGRPLSTDMVLSMTGLLRVEPWSASWRMALGNTMVKSSEEPRFISAALARLSLLVVRESGRGFEEADALNGLAAGLAVLPTRFFKAVVGAATVDFPAVLWRGLWTGLWLDGVSGRNLLAAYGSAVCGRISSGLFTGLRAAPDIREFGRVAAEVDDEFVVSADLLVTLEVVDAFDTAREAVGAGACVET